MEKMKTYTFCFLCWEKIRARKIIMFQKWYSYSFW